MRPHLSVDLQRTAVCAADPLLEGSRMNRRSPRARVEPLEMEGGVYRPDCLLRVFLRDDEGEVLVRGARRNHPHVYPLRGDRTERARGDALYAPDSRSDHRYGADVVLRVNLPEPPLPQ